MTDHPVPAPARELTDDEAKARAEEAYAVHERILAAISQGRRALWTLAEALSEWKAGHYWSALGYDNLTDYLADPGIGMTSATFHNAVRRWNTLVLERSLDSKRLELLDTSKVDIVLRAIERREVKLEDGLADAETLGWRDLREKYFKRSEEEITAESPPADEPAVIVNTGDEAPVWAGDVPADDLSAGVLAEEEVITDVEVVDEPAHNAHTVTSGPLPPTKAEWQAAIDRASESLSSGEGQTTALLLLLKMGMAQIGQEF